MWAYLLLGVAVLVIAALVGRWFAASPPATLARIIKWSGLVLGGALTVFLAVTGRAGLAMIPLALIVLPALLTRMFGASAAGRGRPSPGRNSNVSTSYLRMTLDHDSGEMSGEVIAGRFAGRRLGDLALDDLIALLDDFRRSDAPSAQLLEAYLDRVHGAEWRKKAAAGAAGEGGPAGAAPSGRMSVAEAREILGVGPDATVEEIKEAHRRLMLKLHPDQGGSTYLASKINQAKDVLLGH